MVVIGEEPVISCYHAKTNDLTTECTSSLFERSVLHVLFKIDKKLTVDFDTLVIGRVTVILES